MRTFERRSDRAVYIGGQLGSRHSTRAVGAFLRSQNEEEVGNALATEGYEDVDCLTFSRFIYNLPAAVRAMKGADVYTHSSGAIVATEGVREATSESDIPTALHLFAPPTPTTRRKLIWRAGVKTFKPGDTGDPDENVASGMLHVVAEGFLHPIGNMLPVLDGRISKYDACTATAATRRKCGRTSVNLAFMSHDGFGFTPTAGAVALARSSGAKVVELKGVHDQLPMYPRTTLAQYHDLLATA